MALPAFLDPIVTLPKQYKMILGVVGLCAIGAAAYFLLLGPGHERVAKLDQSLKTLESELAQDRATLAQLEQARRLATDLEQKLLLVTAKLPNDREMPPLYRTLVDAAFQSGLGVALFQPKEPRVQDYYSEIPIVITAEGGYHELARFLDRVAALPRVVTVAEWKLAGTGRSKDSVHANLTLATYTYRPVGSPPVPKAAEAAERKK